MVDKTKGGPAKNPAPDPAEVLEQASADRALELRNQEKDVQQRATLTEFAEFRAPGRVEPIAEVVTDRGRSQPPPLVIETVSILPPNLGRARSAGL